MSVEHASPARTRVSIVVPTKNVERTLDRCLRSIRESDHPDIELIVVDNYSTDRTVSIAEKYADIVQSAGPERSAQRNLGYELATGDWIVWIDSDMILSPRVISDCLDVAVNERADAVSIPEISIGPGFWTSCRALERSCYLDDASLFNPRFLSRGTLERIGGFVQQMSGPEDAHLRIALNHHGIKCAMAREFIAHDEGRLTLSSIVSKRIYYGRSLPVFAEANPGAMRQQGKSTLRAFWRHRRDLARRPLAASGVLVMRTVEFGAYNVGAWQGRHRA